MQNSARLYRRIFERFYTGQSRCAELIASAQREGKQEEAVRYAHTLKGVAGNLCCPELVTLAKQVEQTLSDSIQADVTEALTQMGELLDSLCATIGDWLSQTGAETQPQEDGANPGAAADVPAMSAQELDAAIKELLKMLEEADAEAVEKLQAIRDRLPTSLANKIAPVLNMVNAYQFDEAIELVEEIFS